MKLRTEYRAAMKAMRLEIPFALVLLPGETAPIFFVEDPMKGLGYSLLVGSDFDSFEGFVFNRFELRDTLVAHGIKSELTAKQLLELDETKIPSHPTCSIPQNDTTTDKIVYRAQAISIIDSFEDEYQKTVLSHIVKLQTISNPVETSRKYFAKHPDCFRYLYYTPISGVWFGASPELLIDIEKNGGSIKSMSLAGTIHDINEGEWDKKNTLEHNMVTTHIISVLKAAGIKDIQSEQQDVKFGDIRHLCHKISGKGDIIESLVLPHLSPTPALCGWPRERAYSQIANTESHSRGCYGGFVGIKNSERSLLYVNLRCAKATPQFVDEIKMIMYNYTLYGGGGLTIYSDPDREWEEAKAKINSLLNII